MGDGDARARDLGSRARKTLGQLQVVLGDLEEPGAADRMPPGTIITSVWDRPVNSTETLIEELRNFVLLGRGARVGVITPDGMVGSEMLRVEE